MIALRRSSDGTSGRKRPWMVAAVGMCFAGIVAAALGAGASARNDAAGSRASFRGSAAEVASTLQLAIEHEQDLVVNASAFILGEQAGTNTDFRRWTDRVHLQQRYPELIGMGEAVIVTAAELPAFLKHAEVDPTDPANAGREMAIIPPGPRPFYCILRVASLSKEAAPAGLDVCAGAAGPLLLRTRDSANAVYMPFTLGTHNLLGVDTPLYQTGMPTDTVAQRRAAFLGWVGTGFNPNVILDRALSGHPGMSLTLRYDLNGSDVTFRSGTPPSGSYAVRTDLHNGWTVQAFGRTASSGVWASGSSISILAGGIALSVVLSLLIFVLATSRERAVRLVRERTSELRHQALHDALTGLPNRALIVDRIDQLLVRNRRNHTSGAAFFVDLDDFKNINDTLGHEAGDQLLIAVAERMRSTLRDADTIGRMGGDEFVVLIDGAGTETDPEVVATRLLAVMREPFLLDAASTPLIVNTSIGIAIGDRPGPAGLLRDADIALYEAKGAGKNCYAVFHPGMNNTMNRRLDLEFELSSALDNGQFRLMYQPIYDIDGRNLVGAEALLRWDHPRLGVIEPEEFMPILEDSSEILAVGRWVLGQACLQAASWHSTGCPIDVSVNISGRQLEHDGIGSDVGDALAESGLLARSLIIEVSEQTLMRNTAGTAQRLTALGSIGVRIAVDNFGAGYSSLAYLQQFPIDCLKIDRGFTSAGTTSPESKALIDALIKLSTDLGLQSLAGGNERPSELQLLREAPIDSDHGMHESQPLTADALATQFKANQVADISL